MRFKLQCAESGDSSDTLLPSLGAELANKQGGGGVKAKADHTVMDSCKAKTIQMCDIHGVTTCVGLSRLTYVEAMRHCIMDMKLQLYQPTVS